MDSSVLIALLVTLIGQSALLWYKLSKVEDAVKESCPFGSCPLYKRATDEAAPERAEREVAT